MGLYGSTYVQSRRIKNLFMVFVWSSVLFLGNTVLNCNYSQWFCIKVPYKLCPKVLSTELHMPVSPYQSALPECPMGLSRAHFLQRVSTLLLVVEVGVIC